MKIARKISLSFLITGVILTFISVSIVFTAVKSSMQKQIFDHLTTTVKSRANHIEDFLEEHATVVELLANDFLLRKAIEAIIKSADTSLTDMAIAKLEEAFEAEYFSKEFYELFVVDPDGRVILSTDKSNIGLDLSASIAFIEGKKETYVGDIYVHKKTEEESMDVAIPILNTNGSKVVGVFIGRVKGTSLYQLTLDRTGLGKTGEIYLVNKDYYVISPSRFKENVILQQKVDTKNARECFQDMEKYASRPREVDHLTDKDREHFRIFEDYRGITVTGTYSSIPKMQWALLAEIDAKEALAPLRFIKLIFILVLIFVPLVAWLVGVYVSRIISGPIHKLHKGTEIIATGNLDHKIDIDAKDEIGQLSRAFDKMTEDLKETTTSINELNQEIANRKQIEAALQESENKYRLLVESTPDWVWTCDVEGRQTFSNKAIEQILGYEVQEILGTSADNLMHAEDRKRNQKWFQKAKEQKRGWKGNVLCWQHKDGSIRFLETTAEPILDAEGNLIGYSGIDRDVTERKLAEDQIKVSLKEKVVLLQEIHHRVKNNMQVIISLLKLQSDKIKDKQYVDMFKDSQDRIKSMALIHEQLYQTENFADIDFGKYVKSFANGLFVSYGVDTNKVSLNIDIKDVSIDLQNAIPCGLIINELVSNSLKYAFPNERGGNINISLHSTGENELNLIISDDGVGIPEDLDIEQTDTMGLHLVKVLAENQLDAKIDLDRTDGTKFHFLLKKGKV